MLNRRRLLFGGAVVTTAAVASTPAVLHALSKSQQWNLPVNQEVISWLKANVIPIASTTPGSNPKDLDFLQTVVGNSRIVSLGEATHATHEFVELKHRVIEYCVAELGFTVIAVEASHGQALVVNDY